MLSASICPISSPVLPQPGWEETDNDPEDLSVDLAQRARVAEGAQASEETPIT